MMKIPRIKILKQILKTGIKTEPHPVANDALRTQAQSLQAEILCVLGHALSIRHVDAVVISHIPRAQTNLSAPRSDRTPAIPLER